MRETIREKLTHFGGVYLQYRGICGAVEDMNGGRLRGIERFVNGRFNFERQHFLCFQRTLQYVRLASPQPSPSVPSPPPLCLNASLPAPASLNAAHPHLARYTPRNVKPPLPLWSAANPLFPIFFCFFFVCCVTSLPQVTTNNRLHLLRVPIETYFYISLIRLAPLPIFVRTLHISASLIPW